MTQEKQAQRGHRGRKVILAPQGKPAHRGRRETRGRPAPRGRRESLGHRENRGHKGLLERTEWMVKMEDTTSRASMTAEI